MDPESYPISLWWDPTDLGSSKLFCCGILWNLDLASWLCHGILGIVKSFCRRILRILDPVFFYHGTPLYTSACIGRCGSFL